MRLTDSSRTDFQVDPLYVTLMFKKKRPHDLLPVEVNAASLGSRSLASRVSKKPRARGYLDGFDELSVWGWAEPVDGEAAVVEILVDDIVVGTTPANIYREDLRNANVGTGGHAAFRFLFSSADIDVLTTRPKTIRARVVGADEDLAGSPYLLKGNLSASLRATHSEPSPVDASVIAAGKRLAHVFFDAEFYLSRNEDVRVHGVDPLLHFLSHGYVEGRDPAPWLRSEWVRVLSTDLESDSEGGVTRLLELIKDASDGTLRWISPRLCPAWIMHQLGVRGAKFLSVLELPIPAGGLSPHPALQQVFPSDEVQTILDLVRSSATWDVADLSIVDLAEYCVQHRDLVEFADDLQAAFAHLWCWGYRENRLKYLGGRTPKDFDDDTKYLLSLAVATRNLLVAGAGYSEGRMQRLPASPLHMLNDKQDCIHRLFECDPGVRETWISVETLFDARVALFRPQSFGLPIGVDGLRRAVIEDRALFSGEYSVETRRVVYSINLGNYDNFPVPPDLDDTSFFLITDALGVPEDSPWTIVRPTIHEVDAKRTCLWYKTHPHLLFPKAEFTIWLDSNVVCLPGSEFILKAHEVLSEVATFWHPDRTCIFDEAEEIIAQRLDHSDTIRRAVEDMRKRGMPANHGLFETNVLFTRIQDMAVREFLDEWWRLIALGSRRDQMSFTFAAYLQGIEISNLDGPHSAKTSRFFSKRPHAGIQGRFV